MPPKPHLVAFLEAEGHGTFGQSLFYGAGSMPDKPDACVLVRPYPGAPPATTKAGFASVPWRFQVLCRAAKADDAMDRAMGIFASLTRAPIAPGYDHARALQAPFDDTAGRDGSGRMTVFCNYELLERP